MIGESLIGKVLDTLFERLITRVSDDVTTRGVKIHASNKHMSAQLREHLRFVEGWASTDSFKDIGSPKQLLQTFVDLNLFKGTPQLRQSSESPVAISVSEIHAATGNMLILGDPGAGKTTSLRRIALDLLSTSTAQHHSFPFLIRLREYSECRSLPEMMFQILDMSVVCDPKISLESKRRAERQILWRFIEETRTVVLIDGLDEVKPELRRAILTDINELTPIMKKARLLITCRTGDYVFNLASTSVFTIAPLSEPQIDKFAKQWLGDDKAGIFVSEIRKTPYSGSEVRPLTLAHLCAIYERSGTIPEKPRTVYRKIIRLMLEEWDEQRGITRESHYANFEVDRKGDFLEAIGYQLTLRGDGSRFTHDQLCLAYDAIYEHFGLPRTDAAKVVREIESHTGLIIEAAQEKYEFAHKSLQEFLAAAHATRLPHVCDAFIAGFPNETALAVVLSSDPTSYFCAVVREMRTKLQSNTAQFFIEPFAQRLYVERVDFGKSSSLAASMLDLASLSLQLVDQRTPQNGILKLLSMPAISTSLLELLETAACSRTGDENALITTKTTPLTPTRSFRVSGRILDMLNQVAAARRLDV